MDHITYVPACVQTRSQDGAVRTISRRNIMWLVQRPAAILGDTGDLVTKFQPIRAQDLENVGLFEK
jgi:hypothetical protein